MIIRIVFFLILLTFCEILPSHDINLIQLNADLHRLSASIQPVIRPPDAGFEEKWQGVNLLVRDMRGMEKKVFIPQDLLHHLSVKSNVLVKFLEDEHEARPEMKVHGYTEGTLELLKVAMGLFKNVAISPDGKTKTTMQKKFEHALSIKGFKEVATLYSLVSYLEFPQVFINSIAQLLPIACAHEKGCVEHLLSKLGGNLLEELKIINIGNKQVEEIRDALLQKYLVIAMADISSTELVLDEKPFAIAWGASGVLGFFCVKSNLVEFFEQQRNGSWRLSSKKIELDKESDIRSISWSPDKSILALIIYDRSKLRYFLQLRTGQGVQWDTVVELPDQNFFDVEGVVWKPDGSLILLVNSRDEDITIQTREKNSWKLVGIKAIPFQGRLIWNPMDNELLLLKNNMLYHEVAGTWKPFPQTEKNLIDIIEYFPGEFAFGIASYEEGRRGRKDAGNLIELIAANNFSAWNSLGTMRARYGVPSGFSGRIDDKHYITNFRQNAESSIVALYLSIDSLYKPCIVEFHKKRYGVRWTLINSLSTYGNGMRWSSNGLSMAMISRSRDKKLFIYDFGKNLSKFTFNQFVLLTVIASEKILDYKALIDTDKALKVMKSYDFSKSMNFDWLTSII